MRKKRKIMPFILPVVALLSLSTSVWATTRAFFTLEFVGTEDSMPLVAAFKEALDKGLVQINLRSENGNGASPGGSHSAAPRQKPASRENLPATAEGKIAVKIINHLCPLSIANARQYKTLGNFGRRVTLCPTIVRPDNEPSPSGAGAAKYAFDFTVAGENGIQAAAPLFVPAILCEDDLSTDVDRDGKWSADTCFDMSYYLFANVPNGKITIRETISDGARLGTVDFYPNVFDGNNDAQSLLSIENDAIIIDTRADNDGEVILYVMNFGGPLAEVRPVPSPKTTPKPTPTPTANPKPSALVPPAPTPPAPPPSPAPKASPSPSVLVPPPSPSPSPSGSIQPPPPPPLPPPPEA